MMPQANIDKPVTAGRCSQIMLPAASATQEACFAVSDTRLLQAMDGIFQHGIMGLVLPVR